MNRWMLLVLLACWCASSGAQSETSQLSSPQNPFLGSVTGGKASDTQLDLSLSDAIDRALNYNLGLLLAGQQERAARGARLQALSDLLPHLHGGLSESVQQINLAAFGFPPLPGVPNIIGPFPVFDVRAYLTQSVMNFHSIHKLHAESEKEKAEQYQVRDARELVVLVTANLYLLAVSEESRVDSAESQLKTAQALYDQAFDMKKAGMTPGIDVLRAQVALESRRQQLIQIRNELEKSKLVLARAIGMPLAQQFRLADRIRYSPMPPITLDAALQRAYAERADYLAEVALVHAAESSKKAAQGKYLPSIMLQADYGDIGQHPNESHGTFSVIGMLRIPLFEGTRTQGEVLEADAQLRGRQAQLADLGVQIEQQVRMVFLDLSATAEQVEVSQKALDLAEQEMQQAQDRFSAGVAGNLEVVQAQDEVATANENFISSLFANCVAKASLARAMGGAESAVKELLKPQM
jgi:outer membrane protein TolC